MRSRLIVVVEEFGETDSASARCRRTDHGDAKAIPISTREHAARFQVRCEMMQVLRPRDDEPWAFGLHQCSSPREWTEEEISLFAEIGRYATLALNNTLLHERAVREMAKVNAILDQIPESAAIYDSKGQLERMNAAAQREPVRSSRPIPRDGCGRISIGTSMEVRSKPAICRRSGTTRCCTSGRCARWRR